MPYTVVASDRALLCFCRTKPKTANFLLSVRFHKLYLYALMCKTPHNYYHTVPGVFILFIIIIIIIIHADKPPLDWVKRFVQIEQKSV